MDKVIDILTRLSFDADPSDIEEVNKHITKQSNLVKELENKIESLNKERKKSGLAVEDYKRINTELAKSKKALENLNGAYKEQTGLIDKLTNKQRALQDQIRAAGSVAEIKALNKELTGVNKELSSLTNIGSGVGGSLKNMAAGFAAGLTAVAALNAGVQFLNESLHEFEESERVTNKLRLTLSNFGKQKYFDELTKQADALAKKIGYLDNDDIVNAQEKLVTYGKVSINQIKALTPVIVEFAAKQQTSVEDATETIIQGLEGQGKAFRQLGISFKDGKTTADNFKTVMTDVFSKVKGSAEDYGNTLAGMNAKTEQALKDVEETTGRYLAPIKKRWLEFKLLLASVFTGNLSDGAADIQVNNRGMVKDAEFGIKWEKSRLDNAVKNKIMTIQQADAEFKAYLVKREAKLQKDVDEVEKASAFTGNDQYSGADIFRQRIIRKSYLKAFQYAADPYKTSSSDPNANEVINKNADTNLGGAADAAQKAADAERTLRDKRTALEQSTALRLIELNAQVNEQRLKGEDETIEKIKQRIELERKAELAKLDMEIKSSKAQGIFNPTIAKNFGNIRAGINTKYDDLSSQGVKAFQDKELQDIEKFNDQKFELELDLIRRKAELNQAAVDAQIKIIDAEAKKEIRVSTAKYNELIRQAKKFGKDYAELITQRDEAEKAIQDKANKAKADLLNKLGSDLVGKAAGILGATLGTDEEGKPKTIGETIFGLTPEAQARMLSLVEKSDQITQQLLYNINTLLQAEIDKEQRIIDAQKERVDKAKELAKTGNSAILTAEEDRLQKQEEAQRKRLRSQRAINAALVASQSAVNAVEAIGVVLSSAKGEPYTLPFRVIAAVAAITGGILATTAAIKSVDTTDTGFFKGDYTGDGDPRDVAGVVHKKEFVYTAKQTEAIGKENLRYIAKNELKPMMLKDGSMVLSKTGDIDYAGIQEGLISHRTAVPVFDTRKLESKIDTLAEIMSSAGINISVDENGLAVRANRINMRNAKIRNL